MIKIYVANKDLLSEYSLTGKVLMIYYKMKVGYKK